MDKLGFTEYIVLMAALTAVTAAVLAWLSLAPAYTSLKSKATGESSDVLSPGQRWEVVKIIGIMMAGFAAFFGLGGTFLIEQSAAAIKVSQVAADLSARRGFLERVAAISGSTPRGTIAAFNLTSCPIGWSNFTPANGRMIIGAGYGAGLTKRKRGTTGGAEKHILTEREMPRHDHGQVLAYNAKRNLEGFEFSGREKGGKARDQDSASRRRGRSEPHNNMPPYIALYFCQKD